MPSNCHSFGDIYIRAAMDRVRTSANIGGLQLANNKDQCWAPFRTNLERGPTDDWSADTSDTNLERGPTDDWSADTSDTDLGCGPDDDRSTITSDIDLEYGPTGDWSTDTSEIDLELGSFNDSDVPALDW